MYDRNAAVAYAHEWAYGRNPKYYDFDGIGGDCTNFISQVLAAGGSKQNYNANGWYYNSLNDRSPSWSGVDELYNFLVSSHTVGPRAEEISLSGAMLGDIIQLGSDYSGFYHSLVIVNAAAGNILTAAHTIDSDHRPLSTYNYGHIRVLHIIS